MEDKEIQYISLSEAAKLTSYSQDYISLLCRTKKMKGLKLGRNWVTTKDWVRDYINKTKGSGEIMVPVRIEKKKTDSEKREKEKVNNLGSEKGMNPVAFKFQFLTFNEITMFAIFFGFIVAAFAYFQKLLITSLIG